MAPPVTLTSPHWVLSIMVILSSFHTWGLSVMAPPVTWTSPHWVLSIMVILSSFRTWGFPVMAPPVTWTSPHWVLSIMVILSSFRTWGFPVMAPPVTWTIPLLVLKHHGHLVLLPHMGTSCHGPFCYLDQPSGVLSIMVTLSPLRTRPPPVTAIPRLLLPPTNSHHLKGLSHEIETG
jgi:hypothetical protein